MNQTQNKNQTETDNVRESFSARLLTDPQYDEGKSIAHIIKGEIKRSGAFKDKLIDYSHAWARSESFDANRAEKIVRDLFTEINGQSMNQMRESFAAAAENFSDEHKQLAYDLACDSAKLMEQGDKLCFNRVIAFQARKLSDKLEVTDAVAKRLMADEFEKTENTKLFDWGKELDAQFYTPQIEAEKLARQQTQRQPRARTGPQR